MVSLNLNPVWCSRCGHVGEIPYGKSEPPRWVALGGNGKTQHGLLCDECVAQLQRFLKTNQDAEQSR